MKNQNIFFSSNSDEYATPSEIFSELDREFEFTLDPCATDENHKCAKYYTKEQDGLVKDWDGENVFCNPPYSKIGEWVKKASREAQKCGGGALLC